MEFETASPFRTALLAVGITLLLNANAAASFDLPGGGGTPGSYFTPFAEDDSGIVPPFSTLTDALLAPGSNVTVGDIQFQGNTGDPMNWGGGEFQGGFPDTVLGYSSNPGSPADYVLDDTSPLGDGLADAVGGSPGGNAFALTVSGFSDFALTGDHDQQGEFTLYLSVLDGIDDPALDDTDFASWENGANHFPAGYDPGTQADLVLNGYLEPGTVLTTGFDPGTAADGDGEVYTDLSLMEGDFQSFLDLLDDGFDVVAVIDNTPGGGEYIDGEGEGGYGGDSGFMGSASVVTDMNLGDGLDFGDGILLTSGVGTPPDSNTSESFSGQASGLGDSALDTLLTVAGDQGLIEPESFSDDATVLGFDFTVPDGINALSLDFMFGTEEFPNWNYPDVAAIIIDGRNYAIFEDGTPLIFDPDTPVADILVDNTDGHLPIEYDGISPVRHLVAPLDPTLDVHTFKAAVSDANDQIYDTGLFLGNLDGLTVDAGVDPSDPILPPPDDDPTDGYDFRLELGDAGIGLDPTTPIWIDPEYAVGYIYTTSNNAFASATLPSGFGDDLYSVSWWDAVNGVYHLLDSGHDSGQWAAGEIINFLTLVDPAGITQFKVEGIEPSAMLDPNDPSAFATGVSFTSGGLVDVNMTPIVANGPTVPEPGLPLLLAGGLLGLVGWYRRRG